MMRSKSIASFGFQTSWRRRAYRKKLSPIMRMTPDTNNMYACYLATRERKGIHIWYVLPNACRFYEKGKLDDTILLYRFQKASLSRRTLLDVFFRHKAAPDTAPEPLLDQYPDTADRHGLQGHQYFTDIYYAGAEPRIHCLSIAILWVSDPHDLLEPLTASYILIRTWWT